MDEKEKQRFNRGLEFAFKEAQGSTGWSMERNRPYDGQPHTDSGERGKTLVTGLTMRDVADCVIRGLLAAGECKKKSPIWDDVYTINTKDMDPIAVIQVTTCEIEKMMGIYPNVPPLQSRERVDGDDTL